MNNNESVLLENCLEKKSEIDGEAKISGSENIDNDCLRSSDSKVCENNNPNMMFTKLVCKQSEKHVFSHHAGILLYSFFLAGLPPVILFAKQLLISVLLGALNIEQSKLLNFSSLKNMFFKFSKTLNSQRYLLGEYSKTDNHMKDLFRYNSSIVNARNISDFYYDPHSKPYRGFQNILKGWCGNLGRPEKLINMDFIHTCFGDPVWLSHHDSFYDLRERFLKNITEFRSTLCIPENQELTMVVDRGIYKLELFDEIINSCNNKIITWEKGYKKGQWDENKIEGKFIMTKYRNNSRDMLFYKFEYMSMDWSKNNKMNQIIVKATNPKGRTIELSIITNEKARAVEEIIRLMFKRWLQENDFKYLKKHFGIDEITSYDTITYSSLKGLIEDKLVKSGEIKSINKDKNKLEKELKKLLLSENQSKNKNKKRENKILVLTEQLSKLKTKIKNVSEKESKLDALIRDETIKLKTNKKALMDVIKIIARNIFYKSIEQFKILYDNYRDDHVMFRNFIDADGFILYGEEIVDVILCPTAQYPPNKRYIFEKFLGNINKANPIMPDGSNRIIQFKLADDSNNEIAI